MVFYERTNDITDKLLKVLGKRDGAIRKKKIMEKLKKPWKAPEYLA